MYDEPDLRWQDRRTAELPERPPPSEELVRVVPERVPASEHPEARWSVYLLRVRLFDGTTALKVGMVGTAPLRRRLAQHHKQFGETEVLAVWSLASRSCSAP